jgi:hypothetical protein
MINYIKINSQSTNNDKIYDLVCYELLIISLSSNLNFEQPNKENEKNKNLHFCRNIPSPVKTALICDNIIWPKIYSHSEDTPPVLLAIAETHLVGEPPWTSLLKLRTNEPSTQEHNIIHRGQS